MANINHRELMGFRELAKTLCQSL
ncbi:hypothetical protein [Klebsiella pneumoniae]